MNVALVSMRTEDVLPRRTVLVRDGRIAAIGPAEELAVPAGTQVIDGQGKYLIPGLIDFHVHLTSADELLSYLAHGVTSVVNLNGAPRYLQWREQVRRGERLGATLYTSGPTTDGDPPTNRKFVSLATPEAGRRTVVEHQRAGYDFIKVYARYTPSSSRP